MSDSPIRLVDAGTVSFIRSQTIYHALGYAQTPETPDTIVFATPGTPYMCLGFFQDAAQELDLDFCKNNNLPVIRREQGGGAVYIDSNQLFVQWIFQQKSLPLNVAQRFRLFVEPLIETYKHFGIDAYFHPVNDVHVSGKKIVGTGAVRIGEAEIVTGNFLFDFDFDTMIRALKVPDDEFREEFSKNIRQYLTTIHQELASPPSQKEVKDSYTVFCEKTLDRKVVFGKFTERELEVMEVLDRKMLTEEWLFQIEKPVAKNRMVKVHAGVYIGQSSFSTDKGEVWVRLSMKENIIEAVAVVGNSAFLNKIRPRLEKILTGLELKFEVLQKKLDSLFLKGENEKGRAEVKQLLLEIIEISKRKPGN